MSDPTTNTPDDQQPRHDPPAPIPFTGQQRFTFLSGVRPTPPGVPHEPSAAQRGIADGRVRPVAAPGDPPDDERRSTPAVLFIPGVFCLLFIAGADKLVGAGRPVGVAVTIAGVLTLVACVCFGFIAARAQNQPMRYAAVAGIGVALLALLKALSDLVL